jgi:hypothetical protein
MSHDIRDQKSSIELVEFRLDQFETALSSNFDRISGKLDNLLVQLNLNEVKQENIRTRVNKLEEGLSKLEEVQTKNNEELNNMKVSLAEKLSWTAGGSALGAIIIKLAESNMK